LEKKKKKFEKKRNNNFKGFKPEKWFLYKN